MHADHAEINLEDIARYPLPGFTQPINLAFSPDDRTITFLYSPEGNLTRQLFALDAETGARRRFCAPPGEGITDENVSLAENLRRERQRQLGKGITDYSWAQRKNRVLIPTPDGFYVQSGIDEPSVKIVDIASQPALDPALSPDGEWVAFVREGEIWVVPAGGGTAQPITSGAGASGTTHGLAEYAAQEEMDRRHGYWWAPDSQRIAFVEVDEKHIPIYRILHQGKDALGEEAQEDHHYPFAGQENARVKLGVVGREGGEPAWLDLGEAEYLARVQWLPDGRLAAQLVNRRQTQLDLVWFDPPSGQRHLLLRETNPTWINLHNLFYPFKSKDSPYQGGFLWASERSGFRHLYLYDRAGDLVRNLTAGEWVVDSLAGVDEDRGLVYFTASQASPLESQLYSVTLEGGALRRITQETGMHTVCLDHGSLRFIDCHDALNQPPQVSLRSLADGSPVQSIYEPDDPRVAQLGLQPPEMVTFPNRQGVTLYGAVYRPPAGFGPGPHPAIVNVYGGPHVQLVTNGWRLSAAMRNQYLARLGYVVLVVDNRGSARRGLAFESALQGQTGRVEVDDQVDGVRWLVQQGLVDAERVGIYGWSYGGYMTAMCMARAPETFKAGVIGAPVTHWDGYDTFYTEHYMGLPQENPTGYQESSVLAHAANIRGKILLVHGLIDENVHFRHTARLINALIRARRPYELLLFPDERHSPRRLEDRVYMEEHIRDFFMENL